MTNPLGHDFFRDGNRSPQADFFAAKASGMGYFRGRAALLPEGASRAWRNW